MISLFFYRILLLLLFPLLLILLLIRSKNNAAYRQRIFERLGFFPKPYQTGGIVVHAASVGEVIALKSFIDKLLHHYTELPITITSFTPTGSNQIKKLFGDKVQHGYLPLDLYPCTRLFLHRLKPKMMIFMETELWPNLIAQSAKKEIKLLLINGRLSQKSLKSYRKVSALITPCLNRFDKILCQSQENEAHFIQLGADKSRCFNSGNLKFDIKLNEAMMTKESELKKLLNLDVIKDKRDIWIVASTHDGDEAIALAAYKDLLQQYPKLLLILVPRHPERFEQVARLCLEQGFTLSRRSEEQTLAGEQVWLLDSLGELMPAFNLSDIVTMGGSFSEVGGHNPLEPALFNKPIIVGHNMSNFNEIMQQLNDKGGILSLVEAQPSKQLVEKVSELLDDQNRQKQLGNNAYSVVIDNQGASDKTLLQVQQLLAVNDMNKNVTEQHGEQA